MTDYRFETNTVKGIKQCIECGDIGNITYNNKHYTLNLNKRGFGCYQVDLINDGKTVAKMDSGNGLLSYESSSSGRWIGLSTGCWYDKCAEYYLYDLSAATDETNTDNGFICVGGNKAGWFVHQVSYNFEVDLEQEMVTWTDGTVLNFQQMLDGEDHFQG